MILTVFAKRENGTSRGIRVSHDSYCYRSPKTSPQHTFQDGTLRVSKSQPREPTSYAHLHELGLYAQYLRIQSPVCRT